MAETPLADTDVEQQEELDITEPKMWKVIMLNDDKTTMDFVVSLLVQVFHMSEQGAIETMLLIHVDGQAVVGIYAHEVAEEKMNTCIRTARHHGYPLQVIIEEDA